MLKSPVLGKLGFEGTMALILSTNPDCTVAKIEYFGVQGSQMISNGTIKVASLVLYV